VCSVPSCLCFVGASRTAIYPLSLHDALPISASRPTKLVRRSGSMPPGGRSPRSSSDVHSIAPRPPEDKRHSATDATVLGHPTQRSEEHTSELQSRSELVCRLLPEKKFRAAAK